MNILIVNAFDAFAGSQRVAATLARTLAASKRADVQVHLGFGSRGFVSELPTTRAWSHLDRPRDRKLFYPLWLVWENLACLAQVLRGGHLWINAVYGIPAALLAMRVAPRRVVIHIHEVSFPRLYDRLLRRAIARGVKAVCVSDHQRRSLGLSCTVLYNSVEFENPSESARNRLVFVGTPTATKGFDLFIQVAAELRDSGLHPVAFVPAISGSAAERLVDEARAAGVTVHAAVTDPKEMFRDGFLTIQASDSRLWVETFSLVAAESIAHLVPVATAGAQVVAEVVGAALAFDHPARDPVVIARDIRTLLADPERYTRLVEACALRRDAFSVDAFRDGALNVLNIP